jgi:Na+-driven multidrug efflux pump
MSAPLTNTASSARTRSQQACWAAATGVAARMGTLHVGAHQVALSLWLLLALVAEAPSIAAQVLGARYLGQNTPAKARAMGKRALSITVAGGTVLGCALMLLRTALPLWFTTDAALAAKISSLVPVLAAQQPLVVSTLVLEGLLVGAGQFKYLGFSTLISTGLATLWVLAVGAYRQHWGVLGVWTGITAMFVGRFAAAAHRLLDEKRSPYRDGVEGGSLSQEAAPLH